MHILTIYIREKHRKLICSAILTKKQNVLEIMEIFYKRPAQIQNEMKDKYDDFWNGAIQCQTF